MAAMSSQSQNRFVAVVLVLIALVSFAAAQAVTLQEQLNAQYKSVQMAGNGTVVAEPGTLLAVQKGGIISVPWKAVVHCAAKFQDNTLHPSTGFCAGMMKSVSQYLQKGNKVYPLKIEVNLDKAKISFQVVSCDSCNGVDPATGMKGEVVFQFAKGYLEKANAGEVEDVIGQVFAISNDDQQAPAQQQQEQQAEPQTIQLGMSPDQVQGAMGKPEKIFNLGAKQIYIYKDLKITFVGGKVLDVQ